MITRISWLRRGRVMGLRPI